MRALLTITVMLAFTKISTVIKGFIPKYRFVRHGYYHPAVRGQQYIDSYSTLFLSARASRVKLSTPGSSLVRLHATKTNLGDDNSIDNERNRFGLSNEYDYNDPSLGGSGPAGSPSESAGPAAYTVRNNRRSEKFNELIKDLRDLISTPGMTRVGVTRSVQVARAFARITLDYSRNRAAFTNPTTKRLSAPKAMRRLFEELGATYIKLGQFIASSPTLFPAEYVSEFQACLDKSPTVPYSEVKKIIEQDLGRPIALVFERINPIPIASASIAQVSSWHKATSSCHTHLLMLHSSCNSISILSHPPCNAATTLSSHNHFLMPQVHRAILKNGTEVAVKVRKPGVDSTLKADLGFLLVTSRIIEFINPSLTAFSLSNIVSDIRESMLDELDFTKEAANLVNFREFLDRSGINDATAPAPYPEASGKRVLTMEYLSGVPLVDLENIKKYSDSPEETLVSALRTWALTVATNDVFHADVHAGNVLVLEDGRVGFIDFGIGKEKESNTIVSQFSSVTCSSKRRSSHSVSQTNDCYN